LQLKQLFHTIVYDMAIPQLQDQPDADGARERLLEAAAGLFALHGYERTTVRDIVRSAGTNLNAINYYFGGKRGLYRAVMLREHARARSFTEGLPRAAANDPLDVRLESLVLRILTFFVSQHSRLPRLVSLEVVNPSDALDEVSPSMNEAESRELRDIVADALGPAAPVETMEECARSVYSQCAYFMFMGESLHRAGSSVFSSAAAVRRLASHITAFSLGGLRALSASLNTNGVVR
jgi:AcrR family transcriptional regulator